MNKVNLLKVNAMAARAEQTREAAAADRFECKSPQRTPRQSLAANEMLTWRCHYRTFENMPAGVQSAWALNKRLLGETLTPEEWRALPAPRSNGYTYSTAAGNGALRKGQR